MGMNNYGKCAICGNMFFKVGNKLYIGLNYKEEIIASYRVHKEFDMVTFIGYKDINEVLKYLKENVFVKRNELALSSNDYLLNDLIGLEIKDDTKTFGKVIDYEYNKVNTLLIVMTGVKKFYIPLVKEYIKKVDLNSVQKNITNISKALGLVQSLITKDEINTETYTPRPLYKKFED